MTDFFIKGADETLKLARILGIRKAFLKARSPSCGVNTVSCFGKVVNGQGVCAYYLKKHGIEIIEKN